ncbi:hypothetical protein ACS0PU_008710 [Formica fusca]
MTPLAPYWLEAILGDAAYVRGLRFTVIAGARDDEIQEEKGVNRAGAHRNFSPLCLSLTLFAVTSPFLPNGLPSYERCSSWTEPGNQTGRVRMRMHAGRDVRGQRTRKLRHPAHKYASCRS